MGLNLLLGSWGCFKSSSGPDNKCPWPPAKGRSLLFLRPLSRYLPTEFFWTSLRPSSCVKSVVSPPCDLSPPLPHKDPTQKRLFGRWWVAVLPPTGLVSGDLPGWVGLPILVEPNLPGGSQTFPQERNGIGCLNGCGKQKHKQSSGMSLTVRGTIILFLFAQQFMPLSQWALTQL